MCKADIYMDDSVSVAGKNPIACQIRRKIAWVYMLINALRRRKNGRHFADDTFKRIFRSKNVKISIESSLKFVAKSPINTIPALVQIIDLRKPGDKPFAEPMLVRKPTNICVTQLHWIKRILKTWDHRFFISFWFACFSIGTLNLPIQNAKTLWWLSNVVLGM